MINLGWSDEVLCNKCKGYAESKEKENLAKD
jgi:hypothetical protein